VPALAAGQTFEAEFAIESLPLLPGRYEIKLHVVDVIGYKFEIVPATFPFEIAESSLYGGRKIDRWFGQLGLKAAVEVRLEETLSGRIVA
jgi:hypothetical protein